MDLPGWAKTVISLLLLLLGAGVLALFALRSGQGQQQPEPGPEQAIFEPDPGFENLRVPEFELTDQDGNTTGAEVFDDHWTVLTFVFTNCVLVCPQLTGETAALQGKLGSTPTRFASITVDPEHDTPEVLRAYAERYQIDQDSWRFLTGDRAKIEKLAREALLFELSEDENPANIITLGDGSTMPNIIHPSAMILIGPDRRVMGRYRYTIPGEIGELERRLRAIFAIEANRG